MRLTSQNEAFLGLRPVRYEFPGASDEWDANWLVVHGEVRTAAGEAWTFDDPCLTAAEALDLADWLRAAGDGRIPAGARPAGGLHFTEPNLAFRVAARDGSELTLRVQLSLESARGRPGAAPRPHGLYAYTLQLHLSAEDLHTAAAEWRSALLAFPVR